MFRIRDPDVGKLIMYQQDELSLIGFVFPSCCLLYHFALPSEAQMQTIRNAEELFNDLQAVVNGRQILTALISWSIASHNYCSTQASRLSHSQCWTNAVCGVSSKTEKPFCRPQSSISTEMSMQNLVNLRKGNHSLTTPLQQKEQWQVTKLPFEWLYMTKQVSAPIWKVENDSK